MFPGGRLLLICILVGVVLETANGLNANCPTPTRVDSCSPKCKDSSCPGAQICCTNICGTKSCTDMNQYANKGSSSIYKGGSSSSGNKGSSSVSCGNVKCGAYEKCQFDRSTKREKCVRT